MALQTDLRAIRTLEPGAPESPLGDRPRCLCRFDDGLIFAYVERGHELVRASDRELWAVERDDCIVSARSGETLAERRGRVYFEVGTGAPLYYERAI